MAGLSARRKSLKAPIHNPYDKFTQPEFDAWIGSITGVLKKALGHVDEDEIVPEESSYDEDLSVVSHGGQETYEEVDEHEVLTHSVDVSKGKARDPREGPGLGSGTVDEPIELDSDEEEEIEQEVEETGNEDEYEEGGEYDEEVGARQREWDEGSGEQALQRADRELEEGDWEEKDEGEEEEEEENWNPGWQSLVRESDVRGVPVDHKQQEEYAKNEYEEDGREADYEDEEGYGEEGSEQGEDNAEPIFISDDEEEENDENVPPPMQIEVKRGPPMAVLTQEEDEEEEEEDDQQERLYSDFEPLHDAEGDRHLQEDPGDDEIFEEQSPAPKATRVDLFYDNLEQPPESNTAFPLIQAEETPEEQSISIRDPWSGPQTYAEDFYSGGNIRLPLDSRLDVNHLTELDAPSGDIASFLTPGVITPSLIGSEGLATPDAALSRTPQPSQGEELEAMEADKDGRELHASVLEETVMSAPVELDQNELQYPNDESQTSAAGPILQFESSEDIFDLDSFKEPSYQERDKSVEPTATKDSKDPIADGVEEHVSVTNGSAIQAESHEDTTMELNTSGAHDNLDIQDFSKQASPEIIDVDEEYGEAEDEVEDDGVVSINIEEVDSTDAAFDVASFSYEVFSVISEDVEPTEFTSTSPGTPVEETAIESSQVDDTKETDQVPVPAEDETELEPVVDSAVEGEGYSGKEVEDNVKDQDSLDPDHAIPASLEGATNVSEQAPSDSLVDTHLEGTHTGVDAVDTSAVTDVSAEAPSDSLLEPLPEDTQKDVDDTGVTEDSAQAPPDSLIDLTPKVTQIDVDKLDELDATEPSSTKLEEEAAAVVEPLDKDVHPDVTHEESKDVPDESHIHVDSVVDTQSIPTLGETEMEMTRSGDKNSVVTNDNVLSVDVDTQDITQVPEIIIPHEDMVDTDADADSTIVEPPSTAVDNRLQDIEDMPDVAATANLGVSTEQVTDFPFGDDHAEAESPFVTADAEDENVDELVDELTYPEEVTPIIAHSTPAGVSQIEVPTVLSPPRITVLENEPTFVSTEEFQPHEQISEVQNVNSVPDILHDNAIAVFASDHGQNHSSPTSLSRSRNVLSADPYPAILSNPALWTTNGFTGLDSFSAPLATETSPNLGNHSAIITGSPTKEKRSETRQDDSDAEGDLDPDYVEVDGTFTPAASVRSISVHDDVQEHSPLPKTLEEPADDAADLTSEQVQLDEIVPTQSTQVPSGDENANPELEEVASSQHAVDESREEQEDATQETKVDPATETDPFKLMGSNSTVAPGAVETDTKDSDESTPAENTETPVPISAQQPEVKEEPSRDDSFFLPDSAPVEKTDAKDEPSKDDSISLPSAVPAENVNATAESTKNDNEHVLEPSGSNVQSDTSGRGAKRKRKSSNPAASRQKGTSARVKKLSAATGKGKGRKKRQDSETPSISSSGASTAAKMLVPGSRASSVGSSATGEGSAITHPSPSVARFKDVSFPVPAIPQLMLHSHARPRRPPYQPLRPTLSLQTQIQTQASSAAKSSTSPNSPDMTSSPSRPTQQLPRSSSMTSPVTTSTRSTRSNCRYHKISLPEEEDEGPHIFFLVPGCSLVDVELIKEEGIQDHGDATYEDSLRKVDDIETLDIHPYVLAVIRKLVGPDKEQDVYYLPKLGEERARKVRHKKKLSRFTSRDSGAYAESHVSSGVPLSPTSSRPPVSVAGSTSTSASRKKKGYDAENATTYSYSSGEEDGSDHEGNTRPPNKKPKTSHEQNGESQSSSQLVSAKSSKRGIKRRLDTDYAAYQPGDTDEDAESIPDEESPKRRKNGKKGLKRARTDIQDSRKMKKPKGSVPEVPAGAEPSTQDQPESQSQTLLAQYSSDFQLFQSQNETVGAQSPDFESLLEFLSQ